MVTKHAIERYRERVRDMPDEAAAEAMRSPIVELAISLGARAVILGTGQRLVLSRDGCIVTVLPKRRS